MGDMRATVRSAAILFSIAGLVAQEHRSQPGEPQFTANNELIAPTDYREWIFLSSGLGMAYGPFAEQNGQRPLLFDNVFVTPASYRAFLASGKWPEKTLFVLELRNAQEKGSINAAGHYQGTRARYEAEVKDSSRFPGAGWAFFEFDESATAKKIPSSATCYTCHPANGAVDNTFVQFYPTLLPVARAKGTLTPAFLQSERRAR
jgi:hypothetical protein